MLAQQEPLSTMFWNSYSYYNPANSGMDYDQFYTIQGRNQWSDLENNPTTAWAIAEIKVDKLHGGLGLNYLYDELGSIKSHKINLNYNYQASIGDNQTLSLGLSFGVHNMIIKGEELIYLDPNDPVIPTETVKATAPNFRAGALYKYGNFKLGLSVLNVDESELDFEGRVAFQNYTHYYLFISHRFKLTDGFELNPNIMYQKAFDLQFENPRVLQINVNGIVEEKYILGISVRSEGTFSLNAGIELFKKIRVLYSYDPPNSNRFIKSQSHELGLVFSILGKD